MPACGSTSRSCVGAECAEADASTDGASGGSASGGSASGGSASGASDGARDTTSSTGSGAADPVGSGGAGTSSSTTGGISGSGGGTGGGGAAGAGGSGGSASGGHGPVPVGYTPGAFECEPAEIETPLVYLTQSQYDNTIFDLLGLETLDEFDGARPSALLVADPPDSISELGWEAYRAVAEAIAEQVVLGSLASNFIECTPSTEGCLPETIRSFGRRAFRRPLTELEQNTFESMVASDASATDADAVEILAAILASPAFLERHEQGGTGDVSLSSHELASRLSYFLWNGPPDEALSAAADADELRTEEQVAEQALRMLEDPRLLRSFAEFHRGYLEIPRGYWGKTEHDALVFPSYSAEVNDFALAELDAFLTEVVASQGSFQDLFLSKVGFVNQYTAQLYGLAPENFGNELVEVELDPTMRPGLLTRVAFLSSFSAYAATNPILRGVFIATEILNVPPPAPPAEAPIDLIPSGEFFTNRERITALTAATPACATCHSVYIDPIGFVLETYDAVGGWQTVDPLGGPIDPVADVFFGDDIKTVQSSLELMQEIANSIFAQRNYADEVVAYAFSRAPNAGDACLADTLTEGIAQGISLQDLWVELARSEEFRVRGVSAD